MDWETKGPKRVVLEVGQPFRNHNGGMITFGPDGMLYVGLGDGGSAGDPQRNGQNLGTLLGTVLRIDTEQAEENAPYGIPADNPFVGKTGARGEIWAYGLRNPWRFSFDMETGDLWVGDVGQNALEEVDIVHPGANYGWNVMEGSRCFRSPSCNANEFQSPVTEYGRDLGCSITGGYVYRGQRIPALEGAYLYADFCSGSHMGSSPRRRDCHGTGGAGAGALRNILVRGGRQRRDIRARVRRRGLHPHRGARRGPTNNDTGTVSDAHRRCRNATHAVARDRCRHPARGNPYKCARRKPCPNADRIVSRVELVPVRYRLVADPGDGCGGGSCGWTCLLDTAVSQHRQTQLVECPARRSQPPTHCYKVSSQRPQWLLGTA